MADLLANRVFETTTTTGTGTLTLLGAQSGYQSFATAIGNGNKAYYTIDAQGQSFYEIGIGTVVTGSPNTLQRTTIIASSNSDNAVNLPAGTKRVYVAPVAAVGKVTVQTFTASDDYTKPTGLRYARVRLVAGGGGGGGAAATTSGQGANGGGGGGGGYAEKLFAADDISDTETVTIGDGGTGGSGASAGTDGGDTSFGSLLSATGGKGGVGGSASSSATFTGSVAGGVGSDGDINSAGDAGGVGDNRGSGLGFAGNGGSSVLGGGSAGPAVSAAGNDGVTPGAGGSGATNRASESARAGGDGADGLVEVTEFY